MDLVCDRDLKIVQAQLGRRITNVMAVLRYCSFGFPILVLSYPIRNGQPFPTIHYLTCPHLVKEVSRLEEKGWISRFENRIANDETFRSAYMLAHEAVRTKRMEMLTPGDYRWKEVLSQTGTGGINELSKVKCLHLHVADYLAGIPNPVGKEVFEMIEAKECTDRLCARFDR